MDETRAGIYVRLSRDDERFGDSMSIENQKLMLTDLCHKQGWQIVDVYSDDGITGLTFQRPGIQRMIEDARNGKINTVLVKDLSRFGRNYIEGGQIIEDLFPSLNIRLIAVNDGVDTAKNQNTDFIPIRNVFNEYYCKDISRKVKTARMASARQGNFQGANAPYGYRLDPDDRHRLLIDEESSVIVQRIFRMRADGRSHRYIADTLNSEQIANPRDYYYQKKGKANPRVMQHNWNCTTISHILRNEVYIGNMVQFKTGTTSYKNHKLCSKPEETWIRCEHTHDPIISMELWEAVQAQRKKEVTANTRQKKKADGEVPLFSGILRCADCGSVLNFSHPASRRKDGTSVRTNGYICQKYKLGGRSACQSHWTAEKDLIRLIESDLAGFVQEMQTDESALRKRMITERNQTLSAEQKLLEQQKNQITARLIELDKLLGRLYEEMLLRELPREVLLDMSSRYNTEKTEKEEQLKILQARLEEYQKTVNDVENWLALLKEYMSGRELDTVLLHKLVKEIRVGQYTKINGVKHQEIEIIYCFE